MAKHENDILNMPVDVICYGTREHYETRAGAIKTYFEAMNATEGSEMVRYQKIYTALVSGSADIVTDGSSERIESKPLVESVIDKTKILEMIKNDEMSINDVELFDKGKCKLLYEDRDIIKALLKQGGWYAAQFLRKYIENDKELILSAARGGEETGHCLVYASAQLQDDKDFVLELIKIDASDIRYVSDRLANDIEVVATAFKYAVDDYDVDSIKESLGTDLLTEMVEAYIDKQQDKTITANSLEDKINAAKGETSRGNDGEISINKVTDKNLGR